MKKKFVRLFLVGVCRFLSLEPGRVPSRRPSMRSESFSTAMAIEVNADVALLSDVARILCSIKIGICYVDSNAAVPIPKELLKFRNERGSFRVASEI